ncbi:hypothetical protein GYMLUDRAFT_260422 [Collybiopsis luxurians FD-317 M1]|uniref:Uncharacterized protein n=1 Tax=Collybiopsis luxurians FD-317 M1 TaxID=944289 RepID=A0A0D0CI19_9AGAR|nr:hypothetical protein GYMLUDRAFT_260422 [Collybiopsis luxurians FD-317 M1]
MNENANKANENHPVRDLRRNAVPDINVYLNQLSPLNPHFRSTPSVGTATLPPIHHFMQMSLSTPQQPPPPPVCPPGLGPPLPENRTRDQSSYKSKSRGPSTMQYDLSTTPIPAHLRVKGIVTSDDYPYERSKKIKHPDSPHPFSR